MFKLKIKKTSILGFIGLCIFSLHVLASTQDNAEVLNSDETYSTYNALIIDPLRAAFGAGRIVRKNAPGYKKHNGPVIIEFERKIKNYSFGIEGYFQNQNLLAEDIDWFDGQVFHESANWRRKHYRVTLLTRWYINRIQWGNAITSGAYSGLGLAVGYSSLSRNYGDIEYYNQHSGKASYLAPLLDIGYKIDFYKLLILKLGLRFGPTLLFESPKIEGEHYRDVTYNSLTNMIIFRTGFRW